MNAFLSQSQRYIWRILPRHILWDTAIVLISLLTGGFVWYSHGMTFYLEDLRRLWLVGNGDFSPPQLTLFAMIGINILTTVYLWLFCRVALVVGLGRTTVFQLFLLLNFNPEYNSVRLGLNPLQGVILLWVMSMWLFLRYHREHLYRAFLLWAGCLIVATTFEPAVWLWVLGLPLCFVFWPGSARLVSRIVDRVKFIAVFYLLCALLIWLIPFFRHSVIAMLVIVAERLDQAMSAMSVFISHDHSFTLAGYDAFLIAWVLVVINAAKNMGLVILGIVFIALFKRPLAVLPGRVWLFFAFSMSYASLIGALSLLYLGHLQSDLLYVPVTMLTLWMCAAAVFYLYQRWRTQRMAPQHRLVLLWLMVAYAIASMIEFGPSADYLRDGGVWAYEHRQNSAVYSNSYRALFFAGESPMSGENSHHMDERALLNAFAHGAERDALLLYNLNRHSEPPAALATFEQLALFHNRRGDRLFVLTLPQQ